MALITTENRTNLYNENKTIVVGKVKPGHVILVREPNNGVQAYIVGKTGNSPISSHDVLIENPTYLTNVETGRIVLKDYSTQCVIVSGYVELKEYRSKYRHD